MKQMEAYLVEESVEVRVTLEQVENLKKRIDCDYQTGEKALRKSRGDIDAAVLYLKKREDSRSKKIINIIEEWINKIFSFDIMMLKNDKKVVGMPVILVLLAVLLFNIPMTFLVVLALVAVISDYSFEIGVRHKIEPQQNKDFKKEHDTKHENKKTTETSAKTYRTIYKSLYNEDVEYISDDNKDKTVDKLKKCEEEKTPLFTEKEEAFDEKNCNEIIIE